VGPVVIVNLSFAFMHGHAIRPDDLDPILACPPEQLLGEPDIDSFRRFSHVRTLPWPRSQVIGVRQRSREWEKRQADS
jgi:hypothetical protein